MFSLNYIRWIFMLIPFRVFYYMLLVMNNQPTGFVYFGFHNSCYSLTFSLLVHTD